MSKEMELRSFNNYEVRESKTDDKLVIAGYIAKFDTLTELFEGYYEKIDRNAFNDTLNDGHDIFLLYHHEWDKPLASRKTGTLDLEVDNIGLKFEARINKNLSYARDISSLIDEGLVGGCSFGFNIITEDVEYNNEKRTATSTLLKVNLYEGSVLCIPAYEDTTVYKREKDILSNERNKMEQAKEQELRQIELDLINLELS